MRIANGPSEKLRTLFQQDSTFSKAAAIGSPRPPRKPSVIELSAVPSGDRPGSTRPTAAAARIGAAASAARSEGATARRSVDLFI